jgi:transposase
VLKTFKKHAKGIENEVIIETTSGKHENLNGRIQSVLAKARGLLNFD